MQKSRSTLEVEESPPFKAGFFNDQMPKMKLRTYTKRHEAYVNAVLDRIAAFYGERLVALAVHGSFARGTNRKDSDLDLLIVVRDAPKMRHRIAEFVDQIEMPVEPLGQELFEKDGILCDPSPYILTAEEARNMQPIYYDLAEHHVAVLDPDGLIERIVRSVRAWLDEIGASKVRRNNTVEWQTKRVGFPGEVRL